MSQEIQRPDLEENIDYLFCSKCRIHVACRRLASGGWEVECPGCAGESGFCKCHLRRFCFGSREQFPPFDPDHLLLPGPGPRVE